MVSCDRNTLLSVFDILLDNAVPFTSAGAITVSVAPSQDGSQVSVRDTGCGIPIEHQATMFQYFSQVDDSPARGNGGLGLGLAIAVHLVELIGGTGTAIAARQGLNVFI